MVNVRGCWRGLERFAHKRSLHNGAQRNGNGTCSRRNGGAKSTSTGGRKINVGPLKKNGEPDMRYKANKPRVKRRPAVVSIESTIAGGKSTLLRKIRDSGLFPNAEIAEEPLHMWQDVRAANEEASDQLGSGASEYNMLDHMYSDITRWGYSFQIWALITRVLTLERQWARLPTDCKFLLSERCWKATNRIFAKCMRKSNAFSQVEWEMYQTLFAFLDTSAPLTSGYIFIEQDLDTAMERMRTRNRSEELSIDESYQQDIIEEHRSWREELQAAGTPVLVLDGNRNIGTDDMEFRNAAEEIQEFLAKIEATNPGFKSQRRAVFETKRLSQGGTGIKQKHGRSDSESELYHKIMKGFYGPPEQFLLEKCGLARGAD